MLVSEIATRVRNQFNDDAGIQITDAHVIRWINDAQRDIALNNDLLEVKATTPVAVGTTNYGIPTNLLTLRSLRYDGIKLKKLSLQEAEELFPPGLPMGNGTPQWFYREAADFVILPAADVATKVLTTIYTRVPVAVAVVGDTPELPVEYHNRIVEYCMAQAAEMDDNPQLAGMKMQQFESKVADTKRMANDGDDFFPNITVLGRDAGYDELW